METILLTKKEWQKFTSGVARELNDGKYIKTINGDIKAEIIEEVKNDGSKNKQKK